MRTLRSIAAGDYGGLYEPDTQRGGYRPTGWELDSLNPFTLTEAATSTSST